MNVSWVFVVALSLLGAANAGLISDSVVAEISGGRRSVKRSLELDADLKEFRALVPEEEIMELYNEYMHKDPEAMFIYAYLRTAEYKNLIRKINNIDDVIKVYDYLQEAGFDARAVVNALSPQKVRRSSRSVRITGGPAGYIADIKSLFPVSEIKALHEKKLKTSPAFAKFVEYWKSPRFQKLFEALHSNQEFQESIKTAKDAGVDLIAIADLYFSALGLQLPNNRVADKSVAKRSAEDLSMVLIEFLNLVPIEKFNAMMLEHLSNDKGLRDAVRYFQTEPFKNAFEKIENMKDVISLYDYLEEAGLEVYTILRDIHVMVGLPPLKPGRSTRSVSMTGGISGLIADYKAILPIDKIKALHEERLKTSPAFARFVEYLKAPRFHEIIGAIRDNEELQNLLKIVKEGGIDIVAIADLYTTMIGLELPSRQIAKRSLNEVSTILKEFLNLVPSEKYSELLQIYLVGANEGFVDAVHYFQSEPFKNTFEKIENMKDVISLYDYLEEAGLEVYTILRDIHFMVGLPPLKPGRSTRSVSTSGGASALIADFKAVLPIDKIKALHEERLKTSPAFARFVEYLKAPRFHEIIGALRANEELQKLVKIVKDGGIDLVAIADVFTTLIGLELPSRQIAKRSTDLKEDLDKFQNLMPKKEYQKLVAEYLLNDPEFIKSTEFFFSDTFKEALQKAESLKDVTNFFDYMEEAGLDPYGVAGIVHFSLGLPPLKSGRQVRSVKITGGIEGYYADHRALIPVDRIKALREELVKTSPAYARLVEYWNAPRLQELASALRANEEFQKQLKIAKDGGIYVQAKGDIEFSILGLEFPKIEQV